MGYWKSKVLPKIKKVFEKNPSKKAAIAEANKSFIDSKEKIVKEIEEKGTELMPKVQEVYDASPDEIKTIIEGKSDGIKKNSTKIMKFIEELVKIEFPGSKKLQEASSKYGPVALSAPILFIFEKVGIVEAIKSFNDSKEEIVKEIEEKGTELKPKVREVYEASPDEIKTIIKEGKSDGFQNNSTEITKFIEELVKIEFPGSKKLQEASSKYDAVALSGSILFIFEKVSTLIEVKKEEATLTVIETVATVEEKKEEVEVKVIVKLQRK